MDPFQGMKKVGFIPFVVLGDPSLGFSEKLVDTLIESGADLIELGVPYSDALADGPVIQSASERASKSISLKDVLQFVAKAREKNPEFPFVIFTYYNPVLQLGVEKFAQSARDAGVYAVLVVDLPPEEAGSYKSILAKAGVKTVFLASPTTTPERIKVIAESSTGFVYYVSRTGVTGEQKALSETLQAELKQLKKLTQRPVAVGFGISSAEQAKAVAEMGDAVVVGSAFVRIVSEHAEGKASEAQCLDRIRTLAKSLSVAISQ
jgi:tryptophan synthase alpha chain